MTLPSPADEALLERDRSVPAIELVVDQAALERAVAQIPESLGGTPRVRRLRYKPGSAVHASVEVVRDGQPSAWFLLAGYAPSSAPKLVKDIEAAGASAASSTSGRWVLAPARTDRALALDRSWPVGFDALGSDPSSYALMAYNPRRRVVVGHPGPNGRQVSKAYASGTRRPRPALLAALRNAGVPTPASADSRWPRVLTFHWVDGRQVDVCADGAAAADSLAVLHRSGVDPARPPLVPARLAHRVAAAARSVGEIRPGLGDLSAALARRLAVDLGAADLGPIGIVHGDLSPDQVVMAGSIAVLLDLDEVRTGPIGWDAATWEAAQVAEGSAEPVALAGDPAPAVLLAAALAVRAVEPFRRRRPGWEHTMRHMLVGAHALLDGEPAPSEEPQVLDEPPALDETAGVR